MTSLLVGVTPVLVSLGGGDSPTIQNLAVPARNEVQSVTLTGSPTGGTFTLTLGADTTGALAYDASTATVQSALVGLTSIGTGNCTVTGAAGAWILTFISGKAATDIAMLTAAPSLTGGTAPAVVVAEVTKGNAAAASAVIYLDRSPTVTAATGIKIAAGASFGPLSRNGRALYLVSDTAATDVRVIL